MSTNKGFNFIAVILIIIALGVALLLAFTHTSVDAADGPVILSENDIAKVTKYIDLNEESGTVIISAGGTYSLSGKLEEGQLYIDVDDSQRVILLLEGAEISNSTEPAIYVANSGALALYTVAGTDNTIVSGAEKQITKKAAEEDAEGGAAVFKDDATLLGEGTLNMYGYINNGLHCSDNLYIEGGSLNIWAVNNGIKSVDSLTMDSGTVVVNAGNAGLKSGKAGEKDTGCITINGGSLDVAESFEGMEACQITINGGELSIIADDDGMNACGGSSNMGGGQPGGGGAMDANQSADGGARGGGKRNENTSGGAAEMLEGSDMESVPDENGGAGRPEDGGQPPEVPSDGGIEMPGGNQPGGGFGGGAGRPEDGGQPPEIPSGGGIEMPGGNQPGGGFGGGAGRPEDGGQPPEIPSGSGMQMPGGMESSDMTGGPGGKGGNMGRHGGKDVRQFSEMTSSGGMQMPGGMGGGFGGGAGKPEDGEQSTGMPFNGTAGQSGENKDAAQTESEESISPSLTINGGNVYVYAGGDGLDSNGDLIINGGTVVVDGPSNNGNGALDSGSENSGKLLVNGGILIAIGGSGMAETPEEESSQCSFSYNAAFSAGSLISIYDEEGKLIFSHTAAKSGDSVVFSSPDLKIGNTYTLVIDDEIYEIQQNSIVTKGGNTGKESSAANPEQGRM